MKALLFIVLLVSFSKISFSKEVSEKWTTDYEVIETKFDKLLAFNQSRFTFEVEVDSLKENTKIIYDINKSGYNISAYTNSKKRFFVLTSAGKHTFRIFYKEGYNEITIPDFEIKSRYETIIKLKFRKKVVSTEPFTIPADICRKPVIYLYPKIQTDVAVSLTPNGKLTFTYPKYQDIWKVNASPEGKLTVNNQIVNYLFWESEFNLKTDERTFSEGYIVNGSNSLEFLEKQLTAFGFTSEEKADFITFWGPRMTTDKEWFVHFVVNEDCQQFADVQFEPKPDHFYRFYILLAPLEEVKNQLKTEPKAQDLSPMKREGFVAFEWGGSYIHSTNL
jgi:hypothetical protein